MNKTLKTMLAIVAGAAAITACQKENLTEGEAPQQAVSVLKPMTFTAYMEGQDPATKTTIDASHYDTDHLYDAKWVAGDKISVYDGAEENNGCQAFTLDIGAGTTQGTFIGEAAAADTYYAIYPYAPSKNAVPTPDEIKDAVGDDTYSMIENYLEYWRMDILFLEEMVIEEMNDYGISPEAQELIIAFLKEQPLKSGAQRDGNSFSNVIIPAEQTVSEGQFVDPKAMMMIAKSDDASSLSFKNICAYIRVTPQFDCHAIGIKSNGGLNIAGTATVNYNEGNPTATVTANGTNEVFLTGTIKAGNNYYIAVLPATLSSGFSIQFLATDDVQHLYTRSTSKSMTLTRNNVTNLGSFETTGFWNSSIATFGTAVGSTDNKEHSWKLITPTLKLATVSTSPNAVRNFTEAWWGNDWVILSKADLDPIIEGKGYSGNKFYGLGILKYVEPRVISVDNSWFNFIWLSDGANGTVHNFGFNINNGDFGDSDYGIIHYKYTK